MSEQTVPISHRELASTLLERPWRVGGSLGRTIFAWPGGDDDVIGLLDTRALAAAVVDAHNLRLVTQWAGAPTYTQTCLYLGLAVEGR